MIEGRLWQGVLLQHTARSAGDEPLGLIQITEPDLQNEHANLNLIVEPSHAPHLGRLTRDVARRTFDDFPLRKLCISYAADQDAVAQCLADTPTITAGRLGAHERCGAEQYVDVIVVEIWRDDLR